MLLKTDEVKVLIGKGKTLFLAGDEALLGQVPKGRWIGGTIPYFMSESGGIETEDKIFVTEAPDCAEDITINFYDEKQLENIPADAPENGFSFIIIPAGSNVHVSYAQNAPNYKNIFMKQIIGWISGVNLANLGKATAKVFNGLTGEKSDAKACVMHLRLPPDRIAEINIINLFKQGDGDLIQFDTEGFSIRDGIINGKQQNFADYILSHNIDTRLPLVANYCGAMVNVSIQEVNKEKKVVNLYAPVFKNVDYKIAFPVKNYESEFLKLLPKEGVSPSFSCNCILNYLYSELKGKKTGNLIGPITFGEIAYQLLNQTLVYLEVKKV
jgi:hypothetical protein